jgi:hypothetical protein
MWWHVLGIMAVLHQFFHVPLLPFILIIIGHVMSLYY